MEKRPLDYAKASMDTMMRKWEAPKLPPEGILPDDNGIFLRAEDSIIIREYSARRKIP